MKKYYRFTANETDDKALNAIWTAYEEPETLDRCTIEALADYQKTYLGDPPDENKKLYIKLNTDENVLIIAFRNLKRRARELDIAYTVPSCFALKNAIKEEDVIIGSPDLVTLEDVQKIAYHPHTVGEDDIRHFINHQDRYMALMIEHRDQLGEGFANRVFHHIKERADELGQRGAVEPYALPPYIKPADNIVAVNSIAREPRQSAKTRK